jgi:hypothetical protein
MKKREWIYCQKPQEYDIECDICGGTNIEWSEYEHKIWCYDCKKDTDGTGGIFDGPIPMGLCEMMGISFDKIRLSDGAYLKMIEKDGSVEWVERKNED